MAENDTLVTALGTVLTLQRWNFLPRIETWVEAENAVYVCHVGYALGLVKGFSQNDLICYLQRCLLKSLSKHFTTDIPVPIRDEIAKTGNTILKEEGKVIKKGNGVWDQLINKNAQKTSALFPRQLASRVKSYLKSDPSYKLTSKQPVKARREIESLLGYAHNRVALEECKVNQKVFKDEYGTILKDIERRIKKVSGHTRYAQIYKAMHQYFVGIKRLKYLRRWNRINRVINTSVLAHTYVVTVLAMLLCWLEENTIKDKGKEYDLKWPEFQYECLLRSLFHDLPESLTGDIIAPVKSQISTINEKVLERVELQATERFAKQAEALVQKDIERYTLLDELDGSKPFSVDSLVKDCDRLALVLECAYERDSGRLNQEMMVAYDNYVRELQKSEWTATKDMLAAIIAYRAAS